MSLLKTINVYVLISVLINACVGIVIYSDYKNHKCKRDCDGISMECFYELHLEWMYTMEPNCMNCSRENPEDCFNPTCLVGDGTRRIVNVYNRQLHGPLLEMCDGDKVIIDIHNQLLDSSTTVHWHGMHQIGSNYMDGVPFVTQCPILQGEKFRYKFHVRDPGTHWYHSHTGLQRITGAYGPMIVRQPVALELNKEFFDFDLSEHVITLSEWSTYSPLEIYYARNRLRMFDSFFNSILINGFGANANTKAPYPLFRVKKGYRYRFRLIHAGADLCPLAMKVAGHNLTIISSDGNDIEPITVNTAYINSGETLDVVIEANQDSKDYVILFNGTDVCENIVGEAILVYEDSKGSADVAIARDDGVVFNCVNTPVNTPNCISYNDVRSLVPMDSKLAGTPDYTHYVPLDGIVKGMPEFKGLDDGFMISTLIHNISFEFPTTPLIQKEQKNIYCNQTNPTGCSGGICVCTHVIEVSLNSLVELVIVDESAISEVSHPMHLHGHNFRMIGSDRISRTINSNRVKELDLQGKLIRNFDSPALKDTISVPDGGYAIIRFIADNPGYWFFHCHVERHAEMGMDLVLRVGEGKSKVPKDFPKCGNFLDEFDEQD